MDEKGFYLANAGRRLAFALTAALVAAACSPLGAPSEIDIQPTSIVGQANAPGTASQPPSLAPTAIPRGPTAVPPSPTPAQPMGIVIDTPAPGTLVGSPVVITGHTTRLPANGVLNYRFLDGAGQQLGTGTIPVSRGTNQPGVFNASLTFSLPHDGGPVSVELTEPGNPAGAPPASVSHDMLVDAQYQQIAIDTPPDGTAVGSPLTITGWAARAPNGGSLNYRVVNSAGQQIGADAFSVGDNPGSRRPFNAELFFDYPINGDTIRVDLYDWNPATGSTAAIESKSLVALPIPQQIILGTPSPMTLVGSPLVISGRTTRFPFNGDLSWRITAATGKELGSGSFKVAGAAGEPTTFNAAPTFQIPRDGGTIHLDVYDQTPADGAVVASSRLDLDVLAQFQAIVIDTPPPGTQVGSPMVLTGRTNLYPSGGQLQYRVIDSAGQEIGAGAFDVDGAPGRRGSFAASLTFKEPANGGNIRVEMSDRAGNDAASASAAIDLFVAQPPPQQIFLDTPAPGTQVGSPMVLTGRTARYPTNGKLNYRVLDPSGGVIGSGQFDVTRGSAGSGGRFTASLIFNELANGGNITVVVYIPSMVSSGIVSESIGLYTPPRQGRGDVSSPGAGA
jgi:immunoglobulin-like protein involved in spore germination